MTSTSRVCLAHSLDGLDAIGRVEQRPAAREGNFADGLRRRSSDVRLRNAPIIVANVESQEIHCFFGGVYSGYSFAVGSVLTASLDALYPTRLN